MGSSMIWEVEFEDYESMINFRRVVKKVLGYKPKIICNHYIAKDKSSLNVIYNIGHLGYVDIIDFWNKKGKLKIKNLFEISICDRPAKWSSIKNIYKMNGLKFK